MTSKALRLESGCIIPLGQDQKVQLIIIRRATLWRHLQPPCSVRENREWKKTGFVIVVARNLIMYIECMWFRFLRGFSALYKRVESYLVFSVWLVVCCEQTIWNLSVVIVIRVKWTPIKLKGIPRLLLSSARILSSPDADCDLSCFLHHDGHLHGRSGDLPRFRMLPKVTLSVIASFLEPRCHCSNGFRGIPLWQSHLNFITKCGVICVVGLVGRKSLFRGQGRGRIVCPFKDRAFHVLAGFVYLAN